MLKNIQARNLINQPPSVTISVIIPTRNRLLLLQQAVHSVLDQTFQDFEIIIVDDASETPIQIKDMLRIQKKDMEETADSFETRIRIIRNEKSQGGSQSRNRAIFAANGKWLAFLDDDDVWQPQKLEQQIMLLQSHPNAIASSSAYTVYYSPPFSYNSRLVSNISRVIFKRKIFPPSQVSLSRLLQSNCLGGASVCMADAQTVQALGGFDSRLRSAQDWDLWIKLRKAGDIVACQKPLVDYHVHFNQRISNNMQAKYLGARRFYFKYKALMDDKTRKDNLNFICYIKSRQSEKAVKNRFKYLLMSIRRLPFKTKFAYVCSSLPRILINRE